MANALLLKNGWSLVGTKDSFGNDVDYIKNTFKFELGSKPDEIQGPDEPYLCPVCYMEYPDANDIYRLPDCGHSLCKECYRYHLSAKITEGPSAIFAFCPDAKCNMIVPPRVFAELLDDSQLAKYK